MAQVTVREACEYDCEEIFRLTKELMVSTNLIDRFKGTVESLRRDGFGKEKHFYCLVAEDQNLSDSPKMVGYILYVRTYSTEATRPVMHIEQVFVSNTHRRQGVCTLLLTKAKQIASERGFCRIQLFVSKRNTSAMNCYIKAGAINADQVLGWKVIKLFQDKINENVEKQNKLSSVGPGSMEVDQSNSCGKCQVSVREACVEDCEEILEMMKELAVCVGESDRLKTNKEIFKRDGFSDKREFYCFVAEESEGSQIIGFLLYNCIYKAWLGADIMSIESMFVKENKRRQGIGTALFERAIKAAVAKGHNTIQMQVQKASTAAMALCRKFGTVNVTEDRGMVFFMFENF